MIAGVDDGGGGALTRGTVNGRPWQGPVGTTMADLVAEVCESPRGIAVARNDEVVPRSQWGVTAVADGDRVEIVTAVAGG